MSTLFVNNLNTASGDTITLPTGKKILGVDAGSIGGKGNIVNVTFGTHNGSGLTTQSTSFVNYTNSNITVTKLRGPGNVAGGAFTAIYQDASASNGNIFYYDYGGSGINCYTPVSYTMIDTPGTTSACVYKTQGCQGSNGGNRAVFNGNAPARIVLMEIAG